MPAVTRQTTKTSSPTPAKLSGVLGRIVPVGSLRKGMKILVYGRGKTGKTRLFSTFPKPSLLIGTEDGTLSINDVPGIDFVFLNQSSELPELISLVKTGKYKTVGLDTCGGLQEIILKEILGLDELPVQRSWGIAKQQEWGQCSSQLKERMRGLLGLADKGIADVVVIAHERNFNDEGGSELLTPTVGAALTPSAAGWLNGCVDYLCQTFIREEVATSTIKVAGKELPQTKKTGKAEYLLRIGPHPIYLTGFRVGSAIKLPDAIVNPTYQKIVDIINGK